MFTMFFFFKLLWYKIFVKWNWTTETTVFWYFLLRTSWIMNDHESNHLHFVLTWARLCRPTSTHQYDPQTPQVTGLIVAIIFEYLWCCVLQGEAGSLQELIVWWFEASKPKVYDFYLGVLTLVCEEQVLQSNSRHGQQSFLSAQQNWDTQELTKLDIKARLTSYF